MLKSYQIRTSSIQSYWKSNVITMIALITMLASTLPSQARILYSRGNTAYQVNATWSTVGHTGAACACTPTAADTVIIGNSNSITVGAASFARSINIEAGASLSLGSRLTITGDFTVNGTFNANNQTVTFDPEATKVFIQGSTSPIQFFKVYTPRNRTRYIELRQNVTIQDSLVMYTSSGGGSIIRFADNHPFDIVFAVRYLNMNGSVTTAGIRQDLLAEPLTQSNHHTLRITGRLNLPSSNSGFVLVYENSGFSNSPLLEFTGINNVAHTFANNSAVSCRIKDMRFTGNGTANLTLRDMFVYGNITNGTNSEVEFVDGRLHLQGSTGMSQPQVLGSTGGARIRIFALTISGDTTVVSLAQNVGITSSSINTGNRTALTDGPFVFGGTGSKMLLNGHYLRFLNPGGMRNLDSDTSRFIGNTGGIALDYITGEWRMINNMKVPTFKIPAGSGARLNLNVDTLTLTDSLISLGTVTVSSAFTSVLKFHNPGDTVHIVTSNSLEQVFGGLTITNGTKVNVAEGGLRFAGNFLNEGQLFCQPGTKMWDFGTGAFSFRTGGQHMDSTVFHVYEFRSSNSPQLNTISGNFRVLDSLVLSLTANGDAYIRFDLNDSITVQTKHLISGTRVRFGQARENPVLTKSLRHRLIVTGDMTWGNELSLAHYDSTSGHSVGINLTLAPKGQAPTYTRLNSSIFYLNPIMDLELADSAEFAITWPFRATIMGNLIQNSSHDFLSQTGGNTRMFFKGVVNDTATIKGNGTGKLHFNEVDVVEGSTVNQLYDIEAAAINTNNNNNPIFANTFNIRTTAGWNANGQTLTFTGGGNLRNGGTFNLGTSHIIIKSTGGTAHRFIGNFDLHKVTYDLVGPVEFFEFQTNHTYNFYDTVDFKRFTMRTNGINVATVNLHGYVKTANPDGFVTNTGTFVNSTRLAVNLLAGNTVDFNDANGTQTLNQPNTFVYRNVNFSGNSIKHIPTNFNFHILGGSTVNLLSGTTLTTSVQHLAPTGAGVTINLAGTAIIGNMGGLFGNITALVPSAFAPTVNIIAGSNIYYNSVTPGQVISPANYSILSVENANKSLIGNASVQNILNLYSGNIELNNADLTIGTGLTELGAINRNAGYVVTLGTSRLVRWIQAGTSPITLASAITFPLGEANRDRTFSLFFSNGDAVQTGGTVGIRHIYGFNKFNVVPSYLEGSLPDTVSIKERSEAGWELSTGNGFLVRSNRRARVAAVAQGMPEPISVPNARMITVPAVGTSVVGSGILSAPVIQLHDLTHAQLPNTYYLASRQIFDLWVAIVNGNWGVNATWSKGTPPNATSVAIIPASRTVTLAGAGSYTTKSLTIDNGATLTMGANQLTFGLNGRLENYGLVNTSRTEGAFGSLNTAFSTANNPEIINSFDSRVDYNGTNAQTITAGRYGILSSSSTGARVLQNSDTIFISNTFTPSTNSYSNAGSTICYNGYIPQNITAFNYFNLTTTGTFTKTLPFNGTVGIAGAFAPATTHSWINNANTITYNSAGLQTVVPFSYNNLSFINGGSRTFATTDTIKIRATLSVSNSPIISTNSTVKFDGTSNQTVPPIQFHNLSFGSNRGSAFLIFSNTDTIKISGNLSLPSINYIVTNSTICFNGGGATNQVMPTPANPSFTYFNMVFRNSFTGSAQLVLPLNLRVNGNFDPSLNPGGGGYNHSNGLINFDRFGGFQRIPPFRYYNIFIRPNEPRQFGGPDTIFIENDLQTWSVNELQIDPTNSTVVFTKAGTKNLVSINYHNLVLAGGGTYNYSNQGMRVANHLEVRNADIVWTGQGGTGLELGSSAASPGRLTLQGNVRFIMGTHSQRNFSRWYGTNKAPTAPSDSSIFPLWVDASTDRSAHIFFNSPNALSTGGRFEISLSDGTNNNINSTGFISLNPLVEEADVILATKGRGLWRVLTHDAPVLRSADSATIQLASTNGLATDLPLTVRALSQGTGSQHNTAFGAPAPGRNDSTFFGTIARPMARRMGLTLTNLTAQNWGIGAADGVIFSMRNANYSQNNAWSTGTVPTASERAIIRKNHNITLDGNRSILALTIDSGGLLFSNNHSITIGNGGDLIIKGKVVTQRSGGLMAPSNAVFNPSTNYNFELGPHSEIEYSRNGNQDVQALNYMHLSTNGNGTRTFADGVSNVRGNFTVGSNNNFNSSSNATVRFNGRNQVIPRLNNSFYRELVVAVADTDTVSFAHNVQINNSGTLRLESGTINNTVVNFSLNSGATMVMAGGKLMAQPNANDANLIFTAADTVVHEYPTSAGAVNTVQVSVPAGQNLTLQPSTSYVANSVTINSGSLALNGGDLTVNTSISGAGFVRGDTLSNLTIAGNNFSSSTLSMHPDADTLRNININRTANATLNMVGKATVLQHVTFGTGASMLIQANDTLVLSDTASLVGEGNGRYVRGLVSTTRVFNDSTENFGNMGFTISGCDSCNMGATRVTRVAGPGTSILSPTTSNSSINRIYQVNPGNQPADSVDITFEWLSDDDFFATAPDAGVVWRSRDNGVNWRILSELFTFADRSMTTRVDGFSWFTIASENFPLPVVLQQFDGSLANGTSALRWRSLSELNTSHFELEYSLDAKDFTAVTTVEAAGNSHSIREYSHLHVHGHTQQTLYYRLKMVDIDGTYEYSPVLTLSPATGQKLNATAWPMPFSQRLQVSVQLQHAQDISISILDLSGKILQINDHQLSAGSHTLSIDIVQQLPAGVYHLQLRSDEGNKQLRVVKQ